MDQFLQAIVNGISLAAIYALVALGFVIIYKATQVFNFAQPALLLLGGYWIVYFTEIWEFNFWIAVGLGATMAALTGIIVERTVLRPMVGKPIFAVAIVTIGLNTVIGIVALDLMGLEIRQMGTPWGLQTISLGSLQIAHRQIAAVITVAILVSLLLAFFKYSRMGLAMRAASFDQEVALTQGVSVSAVFAMAWAISAVLAMFGGLFLGAGVGFSESVRASALKALPVVVVGGLDSIPGAIWGALIVAQAEVFVATYQSTPLLSWTGQGFSQVVPYFVMFIVLLVRPYGLFGTKEVERV